MHLIRSFPVAQFYFYGKKLYILSKATSIIIVCTKNSRPGYNLVSVVSPFQDKSKELTSTNHF